MPTKAYSARIFLWLAGLKPGFQQALDPAEAIYHDFVTVVCDAISQDPMCGLEFNKEYTILRMVDLDFSTRVSKQLIDQLPAHFAECRKKRAEKQQDKMPINLKQRR